jgi:hypothetical protein
MRGTFSLEAELLALSDHTHIQKPPSGPLEPHSLSPGLGSIRALMQQQAVPTLAVEDCELEPWATRDDVFCNQQCVP